MTLDSIHPLVQWISLHPMCSGFVVFLISLSESLAIVGLIVPGVILMTAIGSLIGAGKLPALATLTWAMLGAVAGDGLSYWLGHHYRNRLTELWPFNKFPHWLDKGTEFFKSHGGKSIILGRFIGPIRPTIPVIAGIMGMGPATFLFFNIASAVAWAPLYSLPGILIGASLGQLSPKAASTVLSLVLAILFILWLTFYLLVKIMLYIKYLISKLFKKIWFNWHRSGRLPWLQRNLTTARDPNKGQLGLLFLFVIGLATFFWVLVCIQHESGLASLNEPVYQIFRSLYTDTIAGWAIVIRSFGEPRVLLITALAITAWLSMRDKPAAICWLATILLGICLLQYFKFSVESLRPEGLVQPADGHSFPSRHVFSATLVYGLIIVFARSVLPKQHRLIAWFIALSFIFLIAFASLYLGLHWFTDVLGALALGMVCVTITFFFYRRFVVTYAQLTHILLPGCITLLLAVCVYNAYAYKSNYLKWQRYWPQQTLDINQWWQAHPLVETIYRSSVLKRYTMPLDIHWLGNLDDISHTLQKLGWEQLPQLNLETGLMILSGSSSARLMPIFPRFHRDRLPSLILTKIIDENSKRLVLQLWASDYLTTNGLPLWVGTLRLESIEQRVPFITFYMEQAKDPDHNTYILQLFKSIYPSKQWKYKKMQAPYGIFLIAPKNFSGRY